MKRTKSEDKGIAEKVPDTQASIFKKCKLDPTTEEFKITMRVAAPNMTAWLKVTSQKSGYLVYLPLPIRLIQQIPDEQGGGCIVRGAHGDEATAKESIVEVLGQLNGYALGDGASSWSLAK